MAQVKKPGPKRKLNIGDFILGIILIGIVIGVVISFNNTGNKPIELSYPEFVDKLSQDDI